MLAPNSAAARLPWLLIVLVAAQVFCAGFFLLDIVADYVSINWHAGTDGFLIVELLASLSLAVAIVLEIRFFRWLWHRKERLERSVSVAQAAVHDVIEAKFADWRLTRSEWDIAGFLVKGLTITEIAAMRGSAEGTVKSHLNAIYRKAGVSGRSELLSVILDELMQVPQDRGTGEPA